MNDDVNADGTEHAVKDPASPSRGKEFRWNDYAFCLRCQRPIAQRLGFFLRARNVFTKRGNCRRGNAKFQENVAVKFCVGGNKSKLFGFAHSHIRNQYFVGKAALIKSGSGERAYIKTAAQHHDGIRMRQFVGNDPPSTDVLENGFTLLPRKADGEHGNCKSDNRSPPARSRRPDKLRMSLSTRHKYDYRGCAVVPKSRRQRTACDFQTGRVGQLRPMSLFKGVHPQAFSRLGPRPCDLSAASVSL